MRRWGCHEVDQEETVREARAMARTRPALRDLEERISALEERVTRLEAGRPPPGDGRTTRAASAGKSHVRRCAGCGLPLRRRRGRCAACGCPLDLER
jgi:uncharacterized small protein (DUF1192 family)